MNNLKNLYPCLESIKKYTTCNYEVIVTAYLFTSDNLEKVRRDYPWVKLVESTEIRGFSENNNLALRTAQGKYAYVINDDTLFIDDSVRKLLTDFSVSAENVAIVSPVLYSADGSVQYCGREPQNWFKCILYYAMLWNDKTGSYTNKKGLFKSYNIIGAAFMIRMDIFREVGFFDEYYFFCPEDIALSTLLNKKGYLCMVDSDASIIHLEGMSSKSLSLVQTATTPAGNIGAIHFFSNGSRIIMIVMKLSILLITIGRFIKHRLKGAFDEKPNYNYILSIGDKNTIQSLFNDKTPKQIFIHYYKQINK